MSHTPIPLLSAHASARAGSGASRGFTSGESFGDGSLDLAPSLDEFELPDEWDTRHRQAVWSLQLASREQRFLAEVGEAFASSLDSRETLHTIAHMAVGSIADFCIVDLVGDDGSLQRLAAEDVDDVIGGEFETIVSEVAGTSQVVAETLEVGTVRLFSDLDQSVDDLLVDTLRRSGATSLIVAPIVAQGRRLGVILFGSRQPERPYGPRAAELAAKVARRAAIALENSRRYEEAQRAVRTRDDLLAVVAHDLRNPLGVISMAAELIRDLASGDPGMAKLGLEMIHKSAAQMNRLIQDLLDVTRIETGRLRVDREPEVPAVIVQEAADTLRPLAEGRSLVLETRVEPELPLVLADRGRLLQAIGNLVGNAVKFTPPAGLITISAESDEQGVRFSVRDTGPGIASENLPRLFDRFWQETGADRRGLGLGLTIVKGIVEAHGGRVWAESVLGSGTVISFTIPAHR